MRTLLSHRSPSGMLLPSLIAACLALTPGPLLSADTSYKISQPLIEQLTEDENAAAPFYVVFGRRPDLTPAYRLNYQARGAFVVQSLRQVAARSQAGVQAFLNARGVSFTPFWVENKIFVPSGTLELARTLAARPEVAAIIPEQVFHVPDPQAAAPAAATQGIEWNIARINADDVWNTGPKGAGIVVANIDSGVQYNHPALVRQYRGNNGGSFTHKGNFYDATGVCGSGLPCDNHGHGTHTMGTMLGDDGNGNQVGVAPAADWIACKGCQNSSCSGSYLIACAQWVMDPLGSGDGSARPHVVNNSWGGGGGDAWYQTYVRNWVAAGIFPAFSIGNTGPNCSTAGSPGDYAESFAAGATSSTDAIASYSARGPSKLGGGIKPDVVAPGSGIRSSLPNNTYGVWSGTSMASPHSAGAVALLWSAAPSYRANVDGTRQLIQSNTTPIASTQNCGGVSGAPNNTYGYGLIDVYRAVTAAGGGGTPPNQPPVVEITAPANGASLICGAPVTFTATASDPENGSLTPISWTDNGQSIGQGPSITKTYACTATGAHTIAASAQDSQGLNGSDSITITVYNDSVPSAPSNLTASVSGSTVTLNWKDNSSNETGFQIERKTKSGSWTIIATVGKDITTFKDSPGKGNHSYRVSAVNGSLVSSPSNVVNARVR